MVFCWLVVFVLDQVMLVEFVLLKMECVVFMINVEVGVVGFDGQDEVVFIVVINLGVFFGLLNKIVLGGELSCFFLVFKVCLILDVGGLMFIFDEIDCGVGGVMVDVVGWCLVDLVRGGQVLVVIYFLQVVVLGGYYWCVEKI